jgi:hypothetical protein
LATQIWLIPLANDQESTYFTKLKRKKKKEKPFFSLKSFLGHGSAKLCTKTNTG